MIGHQIWRWTILFLFFWSALPAQQVRLDQPISTSSLITVFQQLETTFGVAFSYDSQLLKNIVAPAGWNNGRLEDQLHFLLEDTDLSFEIVEDYVIVKPSISKRKTEKFCGTIIDEQTGIPLAFANVFIKESTIGVQTNEKGYFEMTTFPSRRKVVEISYLGFQKKVLPLNHFRMQPCRKIPLALATSTLGEVIVEEDLDKEKSVIFENGNYVFQPSMAQIIPGAPDADILQGLQLIPGVTGTDETANGIHIRGGTPDQNLLLWDDIPIYQSGHFFGMVSTFNPDMVEQVDLFKSGYNARYGGGISSVIDIKTKSTIPTKPAVTVGSNLLYANLSAAIPFYNQKAMIMLGARRSYTDFFANGTYNRFFQQVFQSGRIVEDPDLITDRIPLVPSIAFRDINAKLLFKPNTKNTLNFSFLHTYDKLEYEQFIWWSNEQRSFDEIVDKSLGWNFGWHHQWDTNLESKLSFSRSVFNYDYFFTDDVDSVYYQVYQDFENGINEWNLKWNNSWQPAASHTIEWGYQFNQRNFNIKYEEDWYGIDSLYQEGGNGMTQALFGNYVFKVPNQFSFDIGVRYNFYHPTKQHYLEPRFQVMAHPIKALTLRASAGQYYQFVNQLVTDDNDLEGIEQQWIIARKSEELLIAPPIRGTQLNFGIGFTKKSWTIDVEAYTKKINDLSSQKLFFDRFYNPNKTGEADIHGVDFLVKKDWSFFQTMLSYSWSDINYYFVYVNGDENFVPSHFQRHRFIWSNSLSIKNWLLTTKFTLASGIPYTEGIGLDYSDVGTPYVAFASRNVERLPTYHRLDASLLYRIEMGKRKEMKMNVGLSFINVYNRQNLLTRTYFVSYGTEPGQEATMGSRDKLGLPFIPNLVFKVSF